MTLKEWRTQNGKSQADVAKHLRVDQSAVARWEKGSEPGLIQIQRIEGMTGLDVQLVDWLKKEGGK